MCKKVRKVKQENQAKKNGFYRNLGILGESSKNPTQKKKPGNKISWGAKKLGFPPPKPRLKKMNAHKSLFFSFFNFLKRKKKKISPFSEKSKFSTKSWGKIMPPPPPPPPFLGFARPNPAKLIKFFFLGNLVGFF